MPAANLLKKAASAAWPPRGGASSSEMHASAGWSRHLCLRQKLLKKAASAAEVLDPFECELMLHRSAGAEPHAESHESDDQ